jgi:hypothetical protein
MSEQPDDDLVTVGYIKTDWDCPNCGHDNSDEGDCSGSYLECEGCEKSVLIEKVM